MSRTFVYSTIIVVLIALLAPELTARGGGGGRGGGGARGGGRSRGSVRYSSRQRQDRARADRARTNRARTDRARADRAAASRNTKKAQTARHRPAKRPSTAKGRTVRHVPPRGRHVRPLPRGYRRYWWHNRRWYYYGGIWYVDDDDEDDDEDDGYTVTLPPVGVTVTKIPEDAERIKVDGKTQYVFAGIYYTPLWANGKVMYEVVKVDEAAFDAAVKASAGN